MRYGIRDRGSRAVLRQEPPLQDRFDASLNSRALAFIDDDWSLELSRLRAGGHLRFLGCYRFKLPGGDHRSQLSVPASERVTSSFT
ncbi:MAG: hypothetical protein MZU95_02920 [Desulfomicrobium escambiense]|nr:hypothetical protein [Desulfomicrobium escambiense]